MRYLKNIGLLCFSLLLAVLVAEGLSRVVYPISYGQKFYTKDGVKPVDPFVGSTSLTPSLSYRQLTPEFDKDTTHTTRGFRGPAGGFMDPKNPDVIFIGDSMTFGIGLADQETIPYLYCQTLKLHCVNLGIPGASTISAIDSLELFMNRYDVRPRKVNLIMNVMTAALFGGNDLLDNLRDRPSSSAAVPVATEQKKSQPADSNVSKPSLWQNIVEHRKWILEHSNLVRVAYYQFAPVLREKFNPAFGKEQKKLAMDVTHDALMRLDTLSRTHGFEYSIYLVHPMQDLTRGTYTQTLKDIVTIAPKGRVVSTAEALMDTDNPVNYYYPLDGHIRPEGARKIVGFLTSGR